MTSSVIAGNDCLAASKKNFKFKFNVMVPLIVMVLLTLPNYIYSIRTKHAFTKR